MSAGIFTRLADESYIVLKRKSERERIRQKKLTARKRVERFAALLPDICVEGDDGEECIATFFWVKVQQGSKEQGLLLLRDLQKQVSSDEIRGIII